jgi:glycosyltransferase involved in cell wall biosynthesis
MRVAVVPARNEEANLARVIKHVKDWVDLSLVIDDGSEDATGRIASELGCIVLRNDHRAGYGATVRRGLLWCRDTGASAAVTIDADGQHEAGWINQCTPMLDEGADVVFANRFAVLDGLPETKLLSNNFAWHCVKQSIERPPVCEDVSCGLRMYNHRGVLAALQTPLAATSGYAFAQASCAHLHRSGLYLAALNTRAIYKEPVFGTKIGELREFLEWLAACTSMQKEAKGWLKSLDRNLPLSFEIERWRTADRLPLVGHLMAGFVRFSELPAGGRDLDLSR